MSSEKEEKMKLYHHTFQAGENEDQVNLRKKNFGLSSRQGRKNPYRDSWTRIFFNLNDDTLTAAKMHSVGRLGPNEKVAPDGTLTIAHRKKEKKSSDYGNLMDLFQAPGDDPEKNNETQKEADDDEMETVVEGGSLGAAAFGMVKGTVGPAILYLPHGFFFSGYAVAIPAMIFATAMYIYNSYKLLECWKVESNKNKQLIEHLESLLGKDYGSTAVAAVQPKGDTALLSYPELAKRGLGKYSVLVEVGIASFQFGVCLTYLIFVPANLAQCIYSVFGFQPSKIILMWMMILVEIPLSWIRDIRKLTPTNVIASLLIAFGLASILLIAFTEGSQTRTDALTGDTSFVFADNLKSMKPITESWLFFVGTSFFMMEGSITLIVPMQEAVYSNADRAKFPDLNKNVTVWICLFYIFFSGMASACFGENIQTALTASLHGTLAIVVQFAYSIAVILTFPLQAYPAMEVATRYLMSEQSRSNVMKRNVIASLITISLGIIAVASIDYLGNVVSLLGSLFGIPLALIFPPLMHNSLVVKDSSQTQRNLNYCVVVVGILAMGAASFNTITMWNAGAER